MTFSREETVETPSFLDLIRSYPVRLGVYGIAVVVIYQLVYIQVESAGAAAVGAENGILENSQVVCAVFAAACLFYAAIVTKVGRVGLVTCAALVGYAAARESDAWFETVFFDDAYKYLVGLPLAAIALIVLVMQRRGVIGETMLLLKHPSATLFIVAGIYLCAVCQVFDRPALWGSVADANEMIVTKSMVEEFSELFAYLLIAFSGFESTIFAHSTLRSPATSSKDSSSGDSSSGNSTETPDTIRIAA